MMENLIRIRQSRTPIHSMAEFMEKKSGIIQGVKEVLFVRIVGAGEGLASEVSQMDAAMTQRMPKEQDLIYHRIARLPVLGSPADIAYYGACYESWVSGGKECASSKAVRGNPVYSRLFGGALKQALGLYAEGRAQLSGSMEKNFIVKMLYWHDSLLEGIVNGWNERLTAKLVLSDLFMEQEYLFAFLLTLLGYDVLLLQSKSDISEKQDARGLSQKIVIGEFGNPALPAFDREQLFMSAKRDHSFGQGAASVPPPGPVTVKLPPRPKRAANPAVLSTAIQGASAGMDRALPAGNPRASAPPAEKSFEELALLASSVVMIAIHGANGDIIGTGSGIMVGRDGYILTNNHVACGGRYYSVRIEDDEKVYTTDELIKYHSTLDLAILRIVRRLTPLPIYKGKVPLVRGQKVVAIGSPLGLFNSVSDGIISGFRKIDGVDMIQFTAPTSHGSSGGAVLNMHGEVIGISTAGFDAGQNINLAMGYECISRFISGFV